MQYKTYPKYKELVLHIKALNILQNEINKPIEKRNMYSYEELKNLLGNLLLQKRFNPDTKQFEQQAFSGLVVIKQIRPKINGHKKYLFVDCEYYEN